jgi:hypothetical protein
MLVELHSGISRTRHYVSGFDWEAKNFRIDAAASNYMRGRSDDYRRIVEEINRPEQFATVNKSELPAAGNHGDRVRAAVILDPIPAPPMTVDSLLPKWALGLIAEFAAADRRAECVAKELSAVQLNWQPRQDAWSVGQCLEHLRAANDVYLPAISAALQGRRSRRIDAVRLGWFTRRFIRAYIVPNPHGTSARAPRKIAPTKQVDLAVLSAFLRSNESARELVRRAGDFDVNRIRFRNPFIPLLRFTVGAGLTIIAQHQSRHLLQAERVRQMAGFPR